MSASSEWTMLSALVAVLAPLMGVPLTVIMMYLRAIKEGQTSKQAETDHRIDVIESSVREVTRTIGELERTYTTKEEWLRESMHARQQLERLTEMMIKVQTELENYHSLAVHFAKATQAMLEIAARLGVDAGRLTDD